MLKPELYNCDQPPSLRGGVCVCGYVFFPMQSFGCERCGCSDSTLKPKDLAGRGRLIASTVVHLHRSDLSTPFMIGSIALDDGPIIRTMLTEVFDELVPGTRMESTLVSIPPGEDGTPRADLRFMPARGEIQS